MIKRLWKSINNEPKQPSTQPTLASILGGLLCDITQAQDISNWYSSTRLAERYRLEMQQFELPVPNSYIEKLEVEFSLALKQLVRDAGDINQFRYDFLITLKPLVLKYIQHLSANIADSLRNIDDLEGSEPIQRLLLSPIARYSALVKTTAFLKKELDILTESQLKTLIQLAETEDITFSPIDWASDFIIPVENKIKELLFTLIENNVSGTFSKELFERIISEPEKDNSFQSFLADPQRNYQSYLWTALSTKEQPSILADLVKPSNSEIEAKFKIEIKQQDFSWETVISRDSKAGIELEKQRLTKDKK